VQGIQDCLTLRGGKSVRRGWDGRLDIRPQALPTVRMTAVPGLAQRLAGALLGPARRHRVDGFQEHVSWSACSLGLLDQMEYFFF
jgi:hypothetical protein